MDSRQFLILFCVIGITFGGSCVKDLASSSLYCSNIEKSVYMPTDSPIYTPVSIQIVDSDIEVLSNSYFSKINMTKVISLHIDSSTIGSIEDSAFKTTLEKIVISATEIKRLSPVAFIYLQKLKHLHLGHCDLTRINLIGTNSLEVLYINNNSLTEIPKVNCQKLQNIGFEFNKITDISPIENCTNLVGLSFYVNRVNSMTEKHLKKLNKLNYLYANSNPVFENTDGEIPIDLFQNNLMLATLSLVNTGITNIRIGTFSNLNKLKELWLGENKLTRLPEGIFNDLNSLADLGLRKNKIKTIQSRDLFFGLKKLEKLDLSNNILEYIVDDAFSDLSSLKTLQLQNNKLTAFNTENLPSSLSRLNINDNAFKWEDLGNMVKNIFSQLEFMITQRRLNG